ncbi:hypothetical protein AHF37_10608 [Paragonimus kellicotti]|nr:hypothetical protein AHF37_10608 [Paragonimus kellicotti]
MRQNMWKEQPAGRLFKLNRRPNQIRLRTDQTITHSKRPRKTLQLMIRPWKLP